MAARGPYAKGRAKRAEILDAAIEVIAREGYSNATVKNLAEAVGLSQNGLLHYFGSKDELFTEILRHQDARSEAQFNPPGRAFADELVDAVLYAAEDEVRSPGMAQLTMRVAGEATEVDHVAHEFFRLRFDAVRALVERAVEELRADGRIASDVDAAATASLIYAAWDGLRVQWMYDPTIDLRERMAYLLARLGFSVD